MSIRAGLSIRGITEIGRLGPFFMPARNRRIRNPKPQRGKIRFRSSLTLRVINSSRGHAMFPFSILEIHWQKTKGALMFPFWIDFASLSFWEVAPWLMGVMTWIMTLMTGR